MDLKPAKWRILCYINIDLKKKLVGKTFTFHLKKEKEKKNANMALRRICVQKHFIRFEAEETNGSPLGWHL